MTYLLHNTIWLEIGLIIIPGGWLIGTDVFQNPIKQEQNILKKIEENAV